MLHCHYMPLIKKFHEMFLCCGIKGFLKPHALTWYDKFGWPNLANRPDRDGIVFREYQLTSPFQPHFRYKATFVNNMIFPSNPQTQAQTHRRDMFRDGVKFWQALSSSQKAAYNKKANHYWPGRFNFGIPQGISGFNLYMSEYMKGNP